MLHQEPSFLSVLPDLIGNPSGEHVRMTDFCCKCTAFSVPLGRKIYRAVNISICIMLVIPAKAGIQNSFLIILGLWVLAISGFQMSAACNAGMTESCECGSA